MIGRIQLSLPSRLTRPRRHYSFKDDYYDGTGRYYTADEIVEHAKYFLLSGDEHVQQGSESLRDGTTPAEFWQRFEAITGMRVADYHRDVVPFCCTCYERINNGS